MVGRMHGPETARSIQLPLEYDPQPPFDAGSPAKAPAETVELVRGMPADTLSDDAVAKVVTQVRSQV